MHCRYIVRIIKSISYINDIRSRSRLQEHKSESLCRKRLDTEPGESWQLMSHIHSVVYITIQWGGRVDLEWRDRRRAADPRSLFAGGLRLIERSGRTREFDVDSILGLQQR